MLAKDALYDSRLDASGSIQAMNIRSFMCAPLWNRNEVIGVLYCDNPRSKKFTADDLEVFAALCNYAAVAIEQARLSLQLLEETQAARAAAAVPFAGRRSAGSCTGGAPTAAFVAQERDVTVMFCDIVGFTTLCEHAEPQAGRRPAQRVLRADGRSASSSTTARSTSSSATRFSPCSARRLDQADHATRAVRRGARDAPRAGARQRRPQPDRPIRMRIAINSGRALTGDIGSPQAPRVHRARRRRQYGVADGVVGRASPIRSSSRGRRSTA